MWIDFPTRAIALLAEERAHWPVVRRFGIGLGLLASLGMALIAWTPLSWVWFEWLSGLDAELSALATTASRILALLPALSVLLSLQRSVLVHHRDTAPLTWATGIKVAGITAALLVLTLRFDMIGVIAAAIAFVAGRLGGNLYLTGPCRRQLRGGGWEGDRG